MQGSNCSNTVGWSVYNIEQENFDIICEWLESEAEIYSMSEIYGKMIELMGENNDVYTKQWLKTKLQIKY